ncbi:MAG TPA: hypothetical protein VF942_10160 [Acidimicrobiales bacterium]
MDWMTAVTTPTPTNATRYDKNTERRPSRWSRPPPSPPAAPGTARNHHGSSTTSCGANEVGGAGKNRHEHIMESLESR